MYGVWLHGLTNLGQRPPRFARFATHIGDSTTTLKTFETRHRLTMMPLRLIAPKRRPEDGGRSHLSVYVNCELHRSSGFRLETSVRTEGLEAQATNS